MHKVCDKRVDREGRIAPETARIGHKSTLLEPSFLAYDAAQARKLVGHANVFGDDIVEDIGQLAGQAGPVLGQRGARIALFKVCQRRQKYLRLLRSVIDFVQDNIDRRDVLAPEAT